MLTAEKIQQLRDEALESLALEQEDKEEYIFSTEYFMSVLLSWKRWYLKKNQPHNYSASHDLFPRLMGLCLILLFGFAIFRYGAGAKMRRRRVWYGNTVSVDKPF